MIKPSPPAARHFSQRNCGLGLRSRKGQLLFSRFIRTFSIKNRINVVPSGSSFVLISIHPQTPPFSGLGADPPPQGMGGGRRVGGKVLTETIVFVLWNTIVWPYYLPL